VRGKGSDQGERWSFGIWFALVGVSAGTVASFSLIGWTFTQGLYDGGNGTEPLEFESETVILEAESPEGEGIAGELEGLVEPGTEPDVAASPAEPRAGRVSEAVEILPDTPAETTPPEEHHEVEEAGPPHLVPVDEGDDGGCDPDEEGEDPDGDPGEDPDGGPGEDLDGREDPDLQLLLEALDVDLYPDLELDLDLDLLN
jgi:hypothetical protein